MRTDLGLGLPQLYAGVDPRLSQAACASAFWARRLTSVRTSSVMLAKILSSLDTPSDSTLWWSVVFGANLGGNLTPIGSASTLVAVTIIHKHELPLSFVGFVKICLPYAAMQIVLALGYVLLFL